MNLPPPVPGYSWQSSAGSEFALSACLPDGSEALGIRLSARKVAPGEWRVSAAAKFARQPSARLFASALAWAEEAAPALAPGAVTRTLSVDLDAPAPEGLHDVLAVAGLALAVAEDEYRHPLTPLPHIPVPAQLELLPWDEHAAPLFFHAYDDAFRDRPGFPGWDEARWRQGFASSPDFRPDLSRVALDGAEPAAFAVLWVEDGVGWVIQMGVRPQWRGQSLGEALLSHALQCFAREGLSAAALEVATNNPHARALYERLGFRRARGYESWRKPLPTP